MEELNTGTYDMYQDISQRTNGEIYIGVIGSVRSGKSTFIKRFMELMVLPFMEDTHEKERAMDELPQSAQGNTIMTTEPKFVPKEAAEIRLSADAKVKVRLIDCVGYMAEGANGHMENGVERMVKTPWFDYEIPFTKAAEIGTRKVIKDHATIGIVMTSDGSFTDISRENYEKAEEKTVAELKSIGKPFVIILNSQRPYSEETGKLVKEMEEKYHVTVMALNCEQLHKDDINHILKGILFEFPIAKISFYTPRWVEMLKPENRIKANIIQNAKKILDDLSIIKDAYNYESAPEEDYISEIKMESMNLQNGNVTLKVILDEKYYYENISELTGVEVSSEYQLISLLQELSEKKKEFEKVADAISSVKQKGYGVVTPELTDITMEEPVLIRHGNKFGVKMKAVSPSIHMIKANIETEIAPIVGSEEQANDLINYLKEGQQKEEGVWNTNIFGKSGGELMEDGIHSKIAMMDDESQMKLQESMQKIVNDTNGGLVCIII